MVAVSNSFDSSRKISKPEGEMLFDDFKKSWRAQKPNAQRLSGHAARMLAVRLKVARMACINGSD